MRQVTKYEAANGFVYDTEYDALRAEVAMEMVDALNAAHGAYNEVKTEDAVDWFMRTYDFTLKVTK